MKKIALLCNIIILCLLVNPIFCQQKKEFIRLASKKITVGGSTSIGNFHCSCTLKNKDTLFLNDFKEHSYTIAVKSFNCGNFLINRDFQNTLNASKYPYIRIQLKHLQAHQGNYTYTLHVDLVGRKKTFHKLLFIRHDRYLKSQIELNFSDFDLKAPSKLGNTIKVRDKIILNLLFDTGL